jgi:hypothetical protein
MKWKMVTNPSIYGPIEPLFHYHVRFLFAQRYQSSGKLFDYFAIEVHKEEDKRVSQEFLSKQYGSNSLLEKRPVLLEFHVGALVEMREKPDQSLIVSGHRYELASIIYQDESRTHFFCNIFVQDTIILYDDLAPTRMLVQDYQTYAKTRQLIGLVWYQWKPSAPAAQAMPDSRSVPTPETRASRDNLEPTPETRASRDNLEPDSRSVPTPETRAGRDNRYSTMHPETRVSRDNRYSTTHAVQFSATESGAPEIISLLTPETRATSDSRYSSPHAVRVSARKRKQQESGLSSTIKGKALKKQHKKSKEKAH